MIKIAFVYKQASFSMPIGIGYLSAVLKQEGFVTKFFILMSENDISCARDLVQFNPDVICYSIITGGQPAYLNFNKMVKKKLGKVVSVFGGPHATFFPEMIYEDGVDAVCVGEGESAVVEFIKRLSISKVMPADSPNFWIKVAGGISKSSLLPLINNLDSLPYPDREDYFRANSFMRNYGIKQFSAHRGCPYKCTYCFNETYNKLYSNKDIYRSRSPESICEEILYVKNNYPIRSVHFVDDVFTLKKQWVLDFCQEYAKKITIPFSCNIRLNNADLEIVEALKSAHCSLVYVGAEAGNDYVRNKIMKRGMDKDLMLEKTSLFHKYKIKLLTENIIGNPGETYDMALETLRLNQDMKPVLANCSIFTPYPKLPLTQYAIENNFFDGNFNQIVDNYYSETLIEFKNPKDKNRIMNLRCFFSFLVRFPRFEKIILKYLINLRHNRLVRFLGDMVDGYYLFKCVPYSFTPLEFIKTVKQYLSMAR